MIKKNTLQDSKTVHQHIELYYEMHGKSPNHSSRCNKFSKFQLIFCVEKSPISKFDQMKELFFEEFERNQGADQFKDNELVQFVNTSPIFDDFWKIKSKEKKKLFLSKRIGCYFRTVKKMSKSKIVGLLSITFNQLKKSLQEMKLDNFFWDFLKREENI